MSTVKTHGAHLRILDTGKRVIVVPFGYPLRTGDSVEDVRGVVRVDRPEQTIDLADRGVSATIPSCDAVLFPYFERGYRARNGGKILVRTVSDVGDRIRCQQLVHYLRWPAGFYVAATVDDEIAGVIVLSRLAPHMRPKWRRELEEAWRVDYAEALWIRRVSVADRFQRQGIGTALAKAAVEIGKRHWLPRPTLVELIATDPEHHFVMRAGFTKADQGRRGTLAFVDGNGTVERRRETRYYYWKKL